MIASTDTGSTGTCSAAAVQYRYWYRYEYAGFLKITCTGGTIMKVRVLVLFFNINFPGPNLHILATRPTRFWATRPQFWFMTLTTQPLEKCYKDQNHGTGPSTGSTKFTCSRDSAGFAGFCWILRCHVRRLQIRFEGTGVVRTNVYFRGKNHNRGGCTYRHVRPL